jgi:hypothetical protein
MYTEVVMANEALPYVPDPDVRSVAFASGAKIIPPADIRRKHGKSLEALEAYYESYLEMIGGTQIWDVLDCLAAVETEIQSRKKQR